MILAILVKILHLINLVFKNKGMVIKMERKSNFKILVVDDNKNVLLSLKAILEDKDYIVHLVSSGREALQEIENRFFNLVFVDYKMPEMNGVELAKRIRMFFPLLPIIMITGDYSAELVEKAKMAGIWEVILKPFEVDTILSLIEKLKMD